MGVFSQAVTVLPRLKNPTIFVSWETRHEISKLTPNPERPKKKPSMTKTGLELKRALNFSKDLGVGFKDFLIFLCSSLFGEDSHVGSYFSKGLKPPTSLFHRISSKISRDYS